VLDSYLTWRERSATVATAYQSWTSASRDDRATAFDAYLASLDQEEHAAASYRHRIDQAAAVEKVRVVSA
jgi:hypothetical protein